MKLVTYLDSKGAPRAGWIRNGKIYDIKKTDARTFPVGILEFIENYGQVYPLLQEISSEIDETQAEFSLSKGKLAAPLPVPKSIRDFYAFEEHVKSARRRRGLDMIPEWYRIAAFYFTNSLAVYGTDTEVPFPAKSKKWDYELEIACVIGKKGINIPPEQAEEHIAGYMIMNDWSARDIQREEMKVGLGPAKGKDFAISFGPWLATPDELEPYRLNDRYDLEMTAKINGKILSRGNAKTIYHPFSEMIARASENVMLYPGEIIGSGTVGSGCILELGEETHPYLKAGDVVEMEITGLGRLTNTVRSCVEK